MALIDTSVWISLYRKEGKPLGEIVTALTIAKKAFICGPIWVEYIGGFRNKKLRAQHSKLFSTYPWLEIDKSIYRLAVELMSNQPGIAPLDAQIAATAISHKQPLLTLDKDFQKLLTSGLKLLDC